MQVGLQLVNVVNEIGSSDFFHSFFSTVSKNLEQSEWGSRYPVLMTILYKGELPQQYAIDALLELDDIVSKFRTLPPDRIVWDVEHPEKRPPWGSNIYPHIKDLSKYFVTSTGTDLLYLMRNVFEEMRDRGGVLKIVKV